MRLQLDKVSRLMADSVALLHGACFPEDAWGPSAVADILGMVGFFGHIAWEHETTSGFALALDLGQQCEILSLGVLPEFRRRGVGTALLDAVRGEAVHRGAESILLEVAIDNTAALALYARQGFTPVGRRQNYYRRGQNLHDALVLRLALPAVAHPS
jgi:[ribosomal protein S18]-alanine N-acetyltransferase